MMRWLVLLIFVVLTAAPAVPASFSHSYTPRLFFNVTASSSVLRYDPMYYSFEAYGLHPPNVTPIEVVIARNAAVTNTGLALL